MLNTKPVVYYHPDPETEYIEMGHSAQIFGVMNHPSPRVTNGEKSYVQTSPVVKKVERTLDGWIFETENTIYQPISCQRDLFEEVSPPL